MTGWMQRYSQRQRDLSRGVDADLVRENRQHYNFAFWLVVLGLLLMLLASKVHSPSLLRWILVGAASASGLAGFLTAIWAQQEAAFLNKPDREEPPTIFKQ